MQIAKILFCSYWGQSKVYVHNCHTNDNDKIPELYWCIWCLCNLEKSILLHILNNWMQWPSLPLLREAIQSPWEKTWLCKYVDHTYPKPWSAHTASNILQPLWHLHWDELIIVRVRSKQTLGLQKQQVNKGDGGVTQQMPSMAGVERTVVGTVLWMMIFSLAAPT